MKIIKKFEILTREDFFQKVIKERIPSFVEINFKRVLIIPTCEDYYGYNSENINELRALEKQGRRVFDNISVPDLEEVVSEIKKMNLSGSGSGIILLGSCCSLSCRMISEIQEEATGNCIIDINKNSGGPEASLNKEGLTKEKIKEIVERLLYLGIIKIDFLKFLFKE